MKNLKIFIFSLSICLSFNVNAEDNILYNSMLELAEKGDFRAQFFLGQMYSEGKGGVKLDYQEAMKWWMKAAEQNYNVAQYNLGVMYKNGYGVRQNLGEAKEWFGKACDNGYQDGCDEYKNLNMQGVK